MEELTSEQQEILRFIVFNSSSLDNYGEISSRVLALDETAIENIFSELESLYELHKDPPKGTATEAFYADGSANVDLFDEFINRYFGDGGFVDLAEANDGVLTDDVVESHKGSEAYQESKVTEEIAASLTQPTLGTFDPEKVREGFIPKEEVIFYTEEELAALNEGRETPLSFIPAKGTGGYATPEEEALAALTADRDEVFIQQEVGQLIAALKLANPKELELMAIEFAQAGLYDGYGGYEGIFFEGNEGELTLDERVFASVFQDAFSMAMFTKPAGDITESQTSDGATVHAAGQFGIGLSKMFDIMTGQSGLSAQEILTIYEEGVAEEREENVTQYDPVYLAKAVNEESETLFGRSLTKSEKDACVVFMVDLVKEHHKMNVQMPVVDAQAEAWLQEREPERTKAAQVGDAVSTLVNIIMRGACVR